MAEIACKSKLILHTAGGELRGNGYLFTLKLPVEHVIGFRIRTVVINPFLGINNSSTYFLCASIVPSQWSPYYNDRHISIAEVIPRNTNNDAIFRTDDRGSFHTHQGDITTITLELKNELLVPVLQTFCVEFEILHKVVKD